MIGFPRPIARIRTAALAVVATLATAAVATPVLARAQNTPRGIPVRMRLIGVFDAATGAPIEGVEVKDIFTHLSATTSATGTVILPLDTAGSFLRVHKVGYNMNTTVVANGPKDSLPITLTLDRVAQVLPTVLSKARGVARSAADTSKKLAMSGFYDRRQIGMAPTTSYISQAQIDEWQPKLLSDLVAKTGRPWMFGCRIYIDGALTNVPAISPEPGRYARNLTTGIDQLLDPSMVAGIEVYRSAEVPAAYAGTVNVDANQGAMQTGATDAGCVTLIWTR